MARGRHVVSLKLFLSELVGTAALVTLGLSVVVFDFGSDAAVDVLPTPGLRRLHAALLTRV
jgi:hypothetical protein